MTRVKFCKIIIIIVISLAITGCTDKQQLTDINGVQVEYEINTKVNNIIINEYTYEYYIEDDSIIFVYPNNEEVLIKESESSFAISSYSDKIKNYASPETLYGSLFIKKLIRLSKTKK